MVSQLYIFRFLHQTTTFCFCSTSYLCCISFVSYIKPQLWWIYFASDCVVYLSFPTSNHNQSCSASRISAVVYLSFPTSNHNWIGKDVCLNVLYIFRFLHQTTTCQRTATVQVGCISFVSYIKPQLIVNLIYSCCVEYLSFPTSNHNSARFCKVLLMLYIFRFLHQTTTASEVWSWLVELYIFRFLHQTATKPWRNLEESSLYIFRFLHQTTTVRTQLLNTICCISFVSYIKPQLTIIIDIGSISCISFVSYIKPQLSLLFEHELNVVYLSFPTSNHNWFCHVSIC